MKFQITLEKQRHLAKNANIMCLNYNREEETGHSKRLKEG